MNETFICYLSNLEAPIKALTKDHYVPYSLAPLWVRDNPDNIHYAHRVINFIKADLMPCDWVDQRIKLAYKALMRWNLKKADAKFVQAAIDQWEAYATDPCRDCLLKGQCR